MSHTRQVSRTGRGSRGTRWLPLLGWTALWLAIAAAVVLPYARTYTHLSPFDELVHVDYLVKAQHFELVNGGEKVGQEAMREQACRGHDIPGFDFPSCTTKKFKPSEFPEYGFNTAYPDPPVYYFVTAPLTSLVEILPGVDGVVAAGRSIGVLWLAAGLALTFGLGRRLGASRLAATGGAVLMGATPMVAHSTATITSDAPLLAGGAGLCWLALDVASGRRRWWWLLPATAVTAGVKATALPIVGVLVVFFLLHLHLRRRREDPGDPGEQPPAPPVWRPAVLVPVTAGLVLGGWSLVNSLTAFGNVESIPMRERFYAESLTWPDIITNVLPLFSPVNQGYLPPFAVDGITIAVLMSAFNLVLCAAVLGSAWAGSLRTEVGRLGTATLAAMLVSGPALVVVIYLGSHSYIPIPFRYGIGLVPPAVALLAWAASQRRGGGALVLGFGVATLIALLLQTA